MVRENVDIVFRESGIRVIKRRIDELGVSANNATRGVFLLQRALFVLGGFGITRSLTQQLDQLTNLENRLTLTTNSARELQNVQTELFAIARRSRADLEGVAQSYTRTALSAKALGRSQAEVLKFTESVTKASILSGASTREINASLVQLGQGIASNRLGGDELRSILEQLPFVADVIAKELGVTRGQLRELGSEGKITGDIILDAFKNAAGEIDNLFSQTQPTIEQSFAVLRTNFKEFLDSLDDATGLSAALSNAIILIANNIENLSRALIAAASLAALAFAGSVLSSVIAYAQALKATSIKSTAVLNKLVAIRAATVAKTQAQIADNGVAQVQIGQNLALIRQQKILLQQAFLDAKFTVQNGRARSVLTGQFVSLSAAKANLLRINTQLAAVESVEAGLAARLAQARTAQAAATNALAGAQTRLAASTAAQASAGARLAATFPLLTGVVLLLKKAFVGLFAILLANPFTAVIAAIAIAAVAIVAFGDKVEFASLGFVTLKDLAVAAFQLLNESIAPYLGPVWDLVKRGANIAGTAIKGTFSVLGQAILDTITGIINGITFIPRVIIGVVLGINAAWKSIPDSAGSAIDALTDLFAKGMESIAQLGIDAVNKIIAAFNDLAGTKIGELLGIETKKLIPPAVFNNLRTNFGNQGSSAAEAFTTAFKDYYESTKIENVVGEVADKILVRAQENAQNARADRLLQEIAAKRAAELAQTTAPSIDDAGGGAQRVDFQSILNGMRQEIALLQLSNKERRIAQELIKIEEQLKRGLTEAERQLATATIEQLQAARTQAEVLDEIVGPREKAIEQMAALNELFIQGRINVDEYNTALLNMSNTLNESSGTVMGGFKAAIGQSIMTVQEFGEAVGNQFVGFVNSASDALIEFAKTGKLNIRALFAELFFNLAKLLINDLFMRLLGGFLGIGGGGIGAGGFASLLGFSGGGSILPTGPGSTDTQVVQFKKRPDERVDILTPAQQEAQRKGMNGSGSSEPMVSPNNVKILNVLDPAIIGDFLSTADGEKVIMNVLSRNGISR